MIDYLVLVNPNNKIPDNWENVIELDTVKNIWNDDIKIEKRTLLNYNNLKEELYNKGIYVELDTAYRLASEQQKIWDEYEEKYGIEYTKKYVAIPNYSEHHTGLAIDVCLIKDGKYIVENDDMIKEKEIYSKIHSLLANYGFILRYPLGKESITGYNYEPWHFRYINNKDIAKEIMDSGITLEEYLNKKMINEVKFK